MMRMFIDMLWIEAHKVRRSRLPLFTLLGILIVPLVDAFFMIILHDPAYARQAGLISAKAQLMAGAADWPTYLNVLAQAVAVGGIFLFGLIASWVFGREYADGTITDLLAVPVARKTILLAKFIVVVGWCLALAMLMCGAALFLGALLPMPAAPLGDYVYGLTVLAVTTCLVVAAMTPIAVIASIGRGYLLPMGATILLVIFANVLVVAGWGGYFPWAVPALYAGAGEGVEPSLEPASVWIVGLTGVSGMVATYLWWRLADQLA